MNRSLGILCSSGSWGGLEINTLRLAGWMKQRGWKVTLYTLEDTPLTEHARKNGIAVVPIRKPLHFLDLTGAFQLRKKLLRNTTDTLLICSNRDISIAAWTRLFSGNKLRLIYQQHMQVGIDKKDFIHTLRFSRIDAWLTPLAYLAEEIKSRTKFNPKKIHVVPLCIDTSEFLDPEISKGDARRRLELPEDKMILGTIGRLDPQKSPHTCIEALHKLKDFPYVHLMIMGDPTMGEHQDYDQRLRKLCCEYGLEKRVHFRPFNQSIRTGFAALDLFIIPSLDETYGMVTLEAMLCGIPVLGSDSGGTRELLGFGTMGTLFLPGNSFDLARKLKQVLVNFDPLRLMAVSAQEHVQEKFSHHRECEMLEDIIGNLTKDRK